jgi:hypothetical protein
MPRRPFTPRGFGGALVVVSAVYKPEAKGYLELICGDRLKLLCAECVKGSNGNSFSEYAYGRRVRERDTQKLVDRDTQGWFPFELVHYVFTSTPTLCGKWSLELCLPPEESTNRVMAPFFQPLADFFCNCTSIRPTRSYCRRPMLRAATVEEATRVELARRIMAAMEEINELENQLQGDDGVLDNASIDEAILPLVDSHNALMFLYGCQLTIIEITAAYSVAPIPRSWNKMLRG